MLDHWKVPKRGNRVTMNGLTMMKTMAGYNRWMNEKLYEVCASMPDEERKRDMKAFFGSVHQTLNHILLADRIWLSRLTGQPFAVTALNQELYAEFPELRRERGLTDAGLEAVVDANGPESLDELITYTSFTSQKEMTMSRGTILLHVFNHQTHHRGQVTTLMSQLGYDFGVTDLIAAPFARPA